MSDLEPINIIIQDVGLQGPPGPPGPPGSSSAGSLRTVSANTTITDEDDVVLVDASEGDVTVSFPAASGIIGRRIFIKKIDSSEHTVTLQPNGVETIDGSENAVIYEQNVCLTVVSDGTVLRVI